MSKIAFIDMEGVLIPEIWTFLAKQLAISELNLTTREVADYQSLMLYRINILKKHKVTLAQIQEIIKQLEPMAGAFDFLTALRGKGYNIQIISDCFEEFLQSFVSKLLIPINAVYCHQLQLDAEGYITSVNYSRTQGKQEAVKNYPFSLRHSIAVGDAFNDFSMLSAVTKGFLFAPSETVLNQAPAEFSIVYSYEEILNSNF
ncbi:bifunctional phosphoserine phosphatase/homoserine phosphotransferase ThrH [Psychrobacter sp. I-STPA10]|uniref:bifunctional phosphoserine phosphatase/homoserine phosphotransferase ThrH n=1 Tax=Psychrobacter sp. I-STPA10 TaxID=2585769 RepID=UPI001E2DE27D|nr:bifunctional phosphoserine phosphatase/homoserine phosphotransferase ThrH [Psychrobacter sp. I-STPA10]